MKLRDILTGEKQINEYGSSKSGNVTDASVARQIRALVPGQMLQGEVVAKNGLEVQIKLLDSLLLNAKLEQNMNFELGKLMTFEVKNNGNSLLLSPLFTNLTSDANVLKALDMAALPTNETTVDMTTKLMDEGLPIDKNTLQQVYREINTYAHATVMDILNLHKMQLTVNEQNLQQLASYRNFSNQMVDGMKQIIQDLPQVFQGMLQEGNIEGAAKLYQQVMQLVQEGSSAIESPMIENTNTENVLMDTSNSGVTETVSSGSNTSSMLEGTATIDGIVENTIQEQKDVNGQNNILDSNMSALQETDGKVEKQVVQEPGTAQTLQSGTQGTNVAATMLQIEFPDNWKEDSKAFLKLIDTLQKQWALKPEDVADKEKVEELYQRIDKHMKHLSQTLENAGATETTAFKAVQTMEQKLDFMQQMNQVYQFVQLPLKLHYGDAQGDLYVYTNKRNLADSDGKISALLHLDMENLGPMDVYVAMHREKVNTKFYVSDDVMDFLMEHMELLTARLQKRGYHYSCEMIAREEQNQGINSIELLREQEEEITPLVHYAFDVRT